MSKLNLEWEILEQEKPKAPKLKKNLFFKNKKIQTVVLLAFVSTIIQIFFLKSCNMLSNESVSTFKYATVVAQRNISQGDILTEDNTKLVYLGLGESKNNFILNSDFKKYMGHRVKIEVEVNSPILKTMVIKGNQDLSLQEKIPPGKRFYTLDVDLNSMASLIKVGDRVDVIAHMDINGFGNATETILNRIKVIGIGNNFEDNGASSEATSLSFYLSPEEVKILSFMKSYSQFSVSLRNPNDVDSSDSESITFNKFIQNEKIQKIFQNDSFKIIEGSTIKKKIPNVENN